MKLSLSFLGFIAIVPIFYPFAQAGQISVINPSAGSEITGVVSVSPQSSSSLDSSSLPTSNDISLSGKVDQMSSKYIIYNDFFKISTFENFTKDQLLFVKSKLLEVLSANKIDSGIKDLIEQQLALVRQQLN